MLFPVKPLIFFFWSGSLNFISRIWNGSYGLNIQKKRNAHCTQSVFFYSKHTHRLDLTLFPLVGSTKMKSDDLEFIRILYFSENGHFVKMYVLFSIHSCLHQGTLSHPSIHFPSPLLLHSWSHGCWSQPQLSMGEDRVHPGEVTTQIKFFLMVWLLSLW